MSVTETLSRISFRVDAQGALKSILVAGDNADQTAAFVVASYCLKAGLSMDDLAALITSDGKGATAADTMRIRKHRRQIAAKIDRVIRAG